MVSVFRLFSVPNLHITAIPGNQWSAMLTPDEARILGYLRKHLTATTADLARHCTAPAEFVARLLAQLDWSGHVILYHDRQGQATGVEITEAGLKAAAGLSGGIVI